MAAPDVPPEFECPVCLKLLFQPVSLPCGHTFCRRCVEDAAAVRSQCPLCRQPCDPQRSVNVLIQQVIEDRFRPQLAQRQREDQEERREEDQYARRMRTQEEERAGDVLPLLPADKAVFPGRKVFLPVCTTRLGPVRGKRAVGIVCGEEQVGALGVCVMVEGFRDGVLVGKASFRFRVTAIDGDEARYEALHDTEVPEDTREEHFAVAERGRVAVEQHLGRLDRTWTRLEFEEQKGGFSQARLRTLSQVELEACSLWLADCVHASQAAKRAWLESTDTVKRLDEVVRLLETQREPLDVPGAGSALRTNSAGTGLGLIVLIVLLLVCKAFGVFDQLGAFQHRQHSLPSDGAAAAYYAQALR